MKNDDGKWWMNYNNMLYVQSIPTDEMAEREQRKESQRKQTDISGDVGDVGDDYDDDETFNTTAKTEFYLQCFWQFLWYDPPRDTDSIFG